VGVLYFWDKLWGEKLELLNHYIPLPHFLIGNLNILLDEGVVKTQPHGLISKD